MRSDVLNKNSGSYLQFKDKADADIIQLGNKKIQTFVGSLANSTAASVQYTADDVMEYLGTLDITVPSGFHSPQKIKIDKAIFSCTTACGQTLIGNIAVSATAATAENAAATTPTEIFGADASMVAPDGSGASTGYTEADLNFNSAGVTYASPNIELATTLVHVYSRSTTTLNADATAGRYMLQLEYTVI
tara:strand:- start:1605 stop:2174 length:570 start_codon:yes stop_codon:yes gene_type:complete